MNALCSHAAFNDDTRSHTSVHLVLLEPCETDDSADWWTGPQDWTATKWQRWDSKLALTPVLSSQPPGTESWSGWGQGQKYWRSWVM
jgi:hypothetical protein